MVRTFLAAAALALCGLTGQAGAVTLDFEDPPLAWGGWIANGYGGLDWTNFGPITPSALPGLTTSGYHKALVSGTQIAYVPETAAASISAATPFTFDSVYLAAAWRNGVSFALTGYLAGEVVAETVLTLDSTRSFFTFDWGPVDRVTFLPDRLSGTWAGYQNGSFYPPDGAQVGFDDLTVTLLPVPEMPTVPLPAGLPLLAGGLTALGLLRRRARG